LIYRTAIVIKQILINQAGWPGWTPAWTQSFEDNTRSSYIFANHDILTASNNNNLYIVIIFLSFFNVIIEEDHYPLLKVALNTITTIKSLKSINVKWLHHLP
jgi:hypothetical protein